MPLDPATCPRYRAALSSGAPEGLCPKCLLAAGLELLGETVTVAMKPGGLLTDSVPAKPFTGERLRYFGDYELLEEIARGSPDGKLLASGSLDHTARIWDLESRSLLTTLRGHSGRVFTLQFTSDGQRLVTGSWDGSVKVWAVPPRTPPPEIVLERGYSEAMYSPDGRWLLINHTRDGPKSVVLRGTESRQSFKTIRDGRASFSPDSLRLVCVRDRSFDVWDISGAEPRFERSVPSGTSFDSRAAFAPDGKKMALQTETNTISCWDTKRWKIIRHITDELGINANVQPAYSPDGQYFATTTLNRHVTLWNVKDGSKARLLPDDEPEMQAITFSPDSRLLATKKHSGAIRLWNVAAGSFQELNGDVGHVVSLAFSRDGRTLATGSVDGVLKFWNVAARREIISLKAHIFFLR